MSTKNNSCNICYDTDMDYCITSEELDSAIASALSQLRSELEGLENQTYTKIEIDQMIQDLTMGNVDLSNYYTKPQVDGKFEWVYNRLNEIEGKTINIDEDLSSTSTSPVQNKTLYYKFKEYYNKEQIDELIANGGSKIIIDSYLSSTSKNPVQNRIITENLLLYREEINQLKDQIGNIETTGGVSIPSLQFQGYYAEIDGVSRILANYVGDYDGVVNAIKNNSPFLLTYKTDDNGQDIGVLDHHLGIYQPVRVSVGQNNAGQSFISADFMCVSSHPGGSTEGIGEEFEYFTLGWEPVWQSYYVNHYTRYEYDNKLDTDSYNAVENRVITSYINAIITALNDNGIEIQL